ncbi:very-long-chain (3R)-3-hydroxyacyl-CoA dehydratase 2 [Lepisosteus oculatus]|uniref:very-long-chain (3R)-3-hydroxyacyl-CoA dehydratase 2 n=1 Tax=Lepisosteus oculatus TaxID=7918 RepID=UPI0035F514E0
MARHTAAAAKAAPVEAPPRRKKGPGALATAYLVIYNVVMTAGWLVIAVGLVRAYLAKGSHHGLYYSIEKPLKFFQTGALLEILHCVMGIVPSSVVLTGFQVMSRVFLTWAVTHSVKEVQNEDSVLLFVVAWTITEIIRYSFYTFSLLNHLPYLIKWARYTLFIVLYPMGVTGELLTIYAALPYVRETGMYSIRLPNKFNFSFDYYTFLILTMVSYIPLFPQLYFHMLRQRKKVLAPAEGYSKAE